MYQTNAQIRIDVLDVNDNAPVWVSDSTFNVDENSKIIGTLSATDADATSQVTYTVDGLYTDIISIDTETGVLSFIEEPDFEEQSTYNMRVFAYDGELSTPQEITVNINDLDEAPVINSGVIFRAEENQTAIGTIDASDPEGQSLIYSISGTDADALTVNNATGVLAFKEAPDYETKNLYSFVGEVDDGSYTTSKAFNIDIVNLNDNVPEFVNFQSTYSADENNTFAAEVYGRDADGGANTFTVSSSNDGASFNITRIR